MTINKVIKYDLESRAIELRGNKNLCNRDIAKTLSEESKENISMQSVQRFFQTHDKEKSRAVEKSDKLKAKVAEAEINTIDEAMACVTELKDICEKAKKAGDYRTAIQAIDKIFAGLDIVNKVLGKYPSTTNNTINLENHENQVLIYIPDNNRN